MNETGNGISPQAPPPAVPPVPPRPLAFSPVVLSALVYPGAGQFIQKRWLAGGLSAALFTVPFVWFVVVVLKILKAYYALGFEFNTPTTVEPPGIASLLAPFAASLLVYVACLIDAAIAGCRRR